MMEELVSAFVVVVVVVVGVSFTEKVFRMNDTKKKIKKKTDFKKIIPEKSKY